LRALAHRNGRFFIIVTAPDRIHQTFDEALDIRTLAFDAGMSVSKFHASFKVVTNSSPLQYIKKCSIVLGQSSDDTGWSQCHHGGLQVGFESPSRFSRDYKRLFGITPARDAGFVTDRVIHGFMLSLRKKIEGIRF
jgi:AraC-like DNA-binding protein